jgi:hypothetical protein
MEGGGKTSQLGRGRKRGRHGVRKNSGLDSKTNASRKKIEGQMRKDKRRKINGKELVHFPLCENDNYI